MKAGIIGFGYMGHFHLNKSRQLDTLEMIAAYDVNPEKLDDARAEGLTAYDDLAGCGIQLFHKKFDQCRFS